MPIAQAICPLWGAWGGLVGNASPALALGWSLMTLLAWRKSLSVVAIAAFVSILCVTPWCLRNYTVFHLLVPMKSNAGFDAWQANVDDPDGLIGMANFRKHPWMNEGLHRQKIREFGEVNYSRALGAEFQNWVIERPREYIDKSLRRLRLATLSFHESRTMPAFWQGLKTIVLGLPWLSLLIAVPMLMLRVPIPRIYWISAGLMILYLIPYVLITYYDRYGAPLVILKALMVVGFVSALKRTTIDAKPLESLPQA